MVETVVLAALNAGLTSVATASAVTAATAALPSFGTLLTAGSALSSISGGMQQAAVAKGQAKQYQLQARQEELRGRDQALRIRQELASTLATQRAAFGARNIAPSGTAVNLANVSSTQASRDIQTAQFGAGQSADALRSQAGQSKIKARYSILSGLSDAGSTIGTYVGKKKGLI